MRPLHSDWELEHGLTKQVTARASEATHAAVVIAKLILGEANPEGLVELFVEAVQDAAGGHLHTPMVGAEKSPRESKRQWRTADG